MAFIGFDVYGTLVDPLGMDGPLREHVGDLAERFAATWRERQIDWTFRRALMGRYVDFDVVTREAFRATAAILGVAITLSPIDPIKALYWTAVINGVVAVPVMTVMMLMTVQRRVMGKFTITGWLQWLGWTSTLAMAACVVGMAVSWFS